MFVHAHVELLSNATHPRIVMCTMKLATGPECAVHRSSQLVLQRLRTGSWPSLHASFRALNPVSCLKCVRKTASVDMLTPRLGSVALLLLSC